MQCFSQCAKYAVGDANVDCEIMYFLIYTIVNFSFYICMQCVKNVHEDVGLQRVLFFWFGFWFWFWFQRTMQNFRQQHLVS